MKRTLLLAAAAALAAGAAAAAEPDCPDASPRVEVSVEDPEPSLDLGAGMDALRAESGAAGPADPRFRHLGLTASRVEWESEIEASVASASGRACARPERVLIRFRHVEHRVRIARELPRGGCLFRETEAHERRHAAANRAALRRAAADAEAAARRWAASAVGRGATPQSALAALRDDLRRAITPAVESMQAARDAAHGAIDRPEEYERLGRVCPEDHKAIAEGSRRR